jgi:L-ascorbate metabolism protein UlaG (beta-lactamase superfamily)
MQLRLIRNATLRLRYGGVDLLIDPMLGVRNSIRPLGGQPGRNPTVDLPCSIDEVLAGVDAILLSHLHPDHLDDAAIGMVPRHLPVFCRPGDAETMRGHGFDDVRELSEPITWRGLEMTPTNGSHGTGDIGERMGAVIGVVFRAAGEPTLYWAGDTVLCPPVEGVIGDVDPDVIVTHSGGAAVAETPIIMTVDQTVDVARAAPRATVVAVHFESLTHCVATRAEMRAAADAAGIDATRLLVPMDGEAITVG